MYSNILFTDETNKSSKQFQRILELQEKTLSETKDLRGELINFLDQWKINYDKETVGNEVSKFSIINYRYRKYISISLSINLTL